MQKSLLCAGIGAVGSAIAAALGGFDASIQTLAFFMVVDYVSGLIVAGVFHNSKKSESGALESRAGWKGLIRKIATLALVAVAHRIDLLMGTAFFRDGVALAFISNELISIIENAGLMGVGVPKPLMNAIDILTRKADEKELSQ